MNKILSWKPEVNMGNVVSWGISICGVVAVVVWLQADVKELKTSGERMDKRITKVEDRADKLNDSIGEMRGDIRVIRQIVEGAVKK